jgi:hypothetical protein
MARPISSKNFYMNFSLQYTDLWGNFQKTLPFLLPLTGHSSGWGSDEELLPLPFDEERSFHQSYLTS